MTALQAAVAIVVAALAGGGIGGYAIQRSQAHKMEVTTTDDRYGLLLDRVQKKLDESLGREAQCEAKLDVAIRKIAENTVAIAEARATSEAAQIDVRAARTEVIRLEDRLQRVESRADEQADATTELARQFGAK